MVAALLGVLVGILALALTTGVGWGFSLPAAVALVGATAVLDAATFGLLTIGGYAIGTVEPPSPPATFLVA